MVLNNLLLQWIDATSKLSKKHTDEVLQWIETHAWVFFESGFIVLLNLNPFKVTACIETSVITC